MASEGLSVICAGLGSIEENENGDPIGYQKGDFCLDNLKDLLLFLRRDDPQTRDVFMQVCKWNITCKDVIPLIEHFQDDHVLVLNAVKVLVFLTMPIDPSSSDISQQVEYLWMLKVAISHSDIVPIILSLLEGALENLQCDGLKEGDWKLVQLVVTLFRNVLAVQDVSLFQSSGSSTHFLQYRDMFLELLFRENVMDVILVLIQYIGSCEYIRHDNLLLLEIFHYVFMNQDPEMIVHSRILTSEEDMNSTGKTLRSIMEKEEKVKAVRSQNNFNRHSQFSGTFAKVGMDGSKILFKGDPAFSSLNKPMKNPRGQLKKVAWDNASLPSKNNRILEYLNDFISQLLSGGYNDLMQSVRGDIERDGPDINGRDVAVFFRVAEFVTSFQYHKMLNSMQPVKEIDSTVDLSEKSADSKLFSGDLCGPIAASMDWGMFQLVASKWRLAFDGLKVTNDYYYLSSAGAIMKIMIRMIDLILKIAPQDSTEPRTSRVILYKLFYDQTEDGLTYFLLTLMKTFDPHKQSRSDFGNVLEIMHVVLRLMEKLQEHGSLRVSKKSFKRRKKKKRSVKNFGVVNVETDISVCEKSVDSGTSLAEKPISDSSQKVDTASIENIDPPSFISQTKSSEEAPDTMDKEHSGPSSDDDSGTGYDCLDDDEPVMRREIDFSISSLVSSLAHVDILHNLCWLLKFYKVNPLSINHYIICIFRRICDDLELSPILYQLSFLTTFHNILKELKSSRYKDYENIYLFLIDFVRRMLRKMKNQPMLFVEILFSKTRRECCEINSNALAKEVQSLKKETHKLDCDYDNVNMKSMDQKGFNKSIGDALGDDEADVVLSYDIGSRSDNISEDEGKKVVKTRKKNIPLNDDIKQAVKDLYEKYKGCENCKDLISNDLDVEGGISTFQVSRVFKELGIKPPRKKRVCAISKRQLGCEDSTVESKDINNGDSLPQKTMLSRKKIKTFTGEQEIMIQTLYEEYKDNKRCSFLIAKALDADGAFSSNQVSKKLVQLGLLLPRNISNPKKMPTNVIMNNSAVGGDSDTDFYYDDDEPLSQLKRRYKGNSRYNFLNSKGVDVGDDSNDDNEPLLTLMKKRKDAKVAKMDKTDVIENITIKVEEDTLDSLRDEVLHDGLEDDEESGFMSLKPGRPRRPGRRKLMLHLDEE